MTAPESLYIASTKPQNEVFYYRVAREGPVRNIPIPPGTQVKIPGDLSPAQVDHIIRQHAKYGIVAAESLDGTRDFRGVCYSVGKPISGLRRG